MLAVLSSWIGAELVTCAETPLLVSIVNMYADQITPKPRCLDAHPERLMRKFSGQPAYPLSIKIISHPKLGIVASVVRAHCIKNVFDRTLGRQVIVSVCHRVVRGTHQCHEGHLVGLVFSYR